MSKASISRRDLMRLLGLAGACLPFLDALQSVAGAADAVIPKRLVSIVINHGVLVQNWLPYVRNTTPVATTSPGSMLLPPSQFLQKVAFEQRTGCTAIDLTPYGGALSPIHSAKWQSFKKKTAFINNLGCSNAQVQGHTATAMLGGYKNPDPPMGQPRELSLTGETLDVVIGRKLNGRLPLMVKAPDNLDDARFLEESSGNSVRKAAMGFEYLPYLRDPLRTWDRIFGTYVPPVYGPKKRDPSQRRVALLERTLKNVSNVQKDSRLSAADKQRLDNHASIVEGQRATLASIKPPLVAPVATPPTRMTGNPGATTESFNLAKPELFAAQFKNAAAALKMNKEQVVTINSGLENDWLTDAFNLPGYHGNAAHLFAPSLAIIEEVRKVQQFVFDTIADFITELDQVEDPVTGATYLDNTLVLIVNEHDGRPNGHLRAALPSILVGGFGSFQGGKLYDYARPQLATADPSCIYTGFSYSRLVHTVLNTFGVTGAERANMNIQGIPQDWSGADLTDWSSALPGLL